MSEVQKCETCGKPIEQRWESDTPVLADLTAFIQSLFDYQGELVGSSAPDGTAVRDFAIGTSRKHDQSAPVRRLAGLTRERFQRAFGENRTGRKFWWREKPNALMASEYESRRIKYALWMACAIEGITEDELKQLGHIPEGVSVSCDPL